MSQDPNKSHSAPSNQTSDEIGGSLDKRITRKQLLKAGWIVPTVIAIGLPTTVRAQTAPLPKMPIPPPPQPPTPPG